ncbi:DUF87 domain-containing protein [Moorellaceae bacterium AZ2]
MGKKPPNYLSFPSLRLGNDLYIDLTNYADTGLRVGVWASSGRGKTNTVGVLIEEFLEAGFPAVIVDPEGEFWTLKEAFRTLVVGGSHGDLPATSNRQAVKEILSIALDERLAVVFDFCEEPTNAGQQRLALPVLEELFSLATRKRQPVVLAVEEVQVFAPQSASSLTAEIMARISKQGRKRGIILVVASQRTQAVSKEFLTQINFPVIGGFEEPLDYQAVKHHTAGKSFEELHSLPAGRFWFPRLGKTGQVRRRKVTHVGDTPFLSGPLPVQGAKTDAALEAAVAKLSQLVEQIREKEEAEQGEIAALKRRVAELEELLATKDREIEELRIALKVAVTRGEVLGWRQGEATVVDNLGTSHNGTNVPAEGKDLFSPAGGEYMDHPTVRKMIEKARQMVRRRLPGYQSYCDYAVEALFRLGQVTPYELALGKGLASKASERRMRLVCRQLAAAGLAREEHGDRFILALDNIRMITRMAKCLDQSH